MFVSFNSFSKELESCSVEKSKNIEAVSGVKNGIITINVQGNPCYKATLNLEIHSNSSQVYTYKHRFKPHVAIHWEDLEEKDVVKYINYQIQNYNFIECSELPEIKQTGELPYYRDLLVSVVKYNELKSSDCKAYIHTYKHYEGNRIVVFPKTGAKSIVVR